jgi:hypothetical protein
VPKPLVVTPVPAAAAGITRTQYTVQLGELPPAVASGLSDSDDLIE